MSSELAKVLWYYNLIPSIDYSEQKIVCPLHNDINPSMKVDLLENRFYCFGCGKSGDARILVEQLENKLNGYNSLKSYRKYLDILKSKKCSNIKISNERTRAPNRPNKELYIEAYDYYNCLSKVDWCNDSDTVEIDEVKDYMLYRGFKPNTLQLANAKVTYNSQYLLIFPMLDNGVFKGFVCRTTDSEVESKRKYLYNTGFSRSTTLVGNYGDLDYVFVVEGFMDRLKFIQYGINNVVAILGWKMTAEQEKKLKDSGIKTIISALDNDECGKKGTKYLKTCFSNVVRFQYLKNIKDPGEMSQEVFNKCYNKTMHKLQIKQKDLERKNQNGFVRKH